MRNKSEAKLLNTLKLINVTFEVRVPQLSSILKVGTNQAKI